MCSIFNNFIDISNEFTYNMENICPFCGSNKLIYFHEKNHVRNDYVCKSCGFNGIEIYISNIFKKHIKNY